jgi:hypothetical protein
MVARVLPAPDDGRVFKEDLVSFGRSQYALVPASDPRATLEFFIIRHPEMEGLPTPREEVFEAIRDFWPIRSDDILSIAEQAAESGSPLGNAVLDRLASSTTRERLC